MSIEKLFGQIGQGGPVAEILSYLELRELQETASYVCKSFHYSIYPALFICRGDKFSGFEVSILFHLKSKVEVTEEKLLSILEKSLTLRPKAIAFLATSMNLAPHLKDVFHYSCVRDFSKFVGKYAHLIVELQKNLIENLLIFCGRYKATATAKVLVSFPELVKIVQSSETRFVDVVRSFEAEEIHALAPIFENYSLNRKQLSMFFRKIDTKEKQLWFDRVLDKLFEFKAFGKKEYVYEICKRIIKKELKLIPMYGTILDSDLNANYPKLGRLTAERLIQYDGSHDETFVDPYKVFLRMIDAGYFQVAKLLLNDPDFTIDVNTNNHESLRKCIYNSATIGKSMFTLCLETVLRDDMLLLDRNSASSLCEYYLDIVEKSNIALFKEEQRYYDKKLVDESFNAFEKFINHEKIWDNLNSKKRKWKNMKKLYNAKLKLREKRIKKTMKRDPNWRNKLEKKNVLTDRNRGCVVVVDGGRRNNDYGDCSIQ